MRAEYFSGHDKKNVGEKDILLKMKKQLVGAGYIWGKINRGAPEQGRGGRV